MKILHVNNWLPAPPLDGGKMRKVQQLDALCARHEVAVIGRRMSAGDGDWLAGHLPGVRVITVENGIDGGAATMTALRPLVARERFDAVHFSGVPQWPGRRGLEAMALVLDVDSIESRVLETLRDAGRDGISGLDIEAVRMLERHAFARADRVLCCSADDAAAIRRLSPRADIRVVPNAIDVEAFMPAPVGAVDGPARLTFTGFLAYGPNADACAWFASEILPRIRQQERDARFHVVGRLPPADLVAIAADDAIELAADVPDIRPHLRAADVIVVPLRAGSGTRLKILEAFAAGRPVVSTTLGCEGLDVQDGIQLVIADDAASFALATVRLIRDRALADRLATAARAFVRRRFDRSVVAGDLLSVYDGLGCAAPSPPPAESVRR